MTKICFVGNSHLVAVRSAWRSVAHQYPGVDATFFASTGMTIATCTFQDGILSPTSDYVKSFFKKTSGGKGEIIFADYDAVVLIGLGARDTFARRLYKTHRTARHNLKQKSHVVSEDFFLEVLMERTNSEFGTVLHRSLLDSLSMPVVSVALSCPSEDIVGTKRYPVELFDSGDALSLASYYGSVIDTLNREGVITVTQPPETLRNAALTKREFCAGSENLRGAEHDEEDYAHMNSSYGELLLATVLARIPAPPVATERIAVPPVAMESISAPPVAAENIPAPASIWRRAWRLLVRRN